jgi:hypothetical protein
MTPNFHFDASIVAKMAPFVSNEETRYYLRGIHMMADPAGGVRLAATDGHALIVVRDPDGYYNGPESGVIIAVDGHKAFVSACRKKSMHGYKVEGDTTSNSLNVVDVGSASTAYLHPAPFIDGTFPDIARVVPRFDKSKRGIASGFNPDLVYRFRGFGSFIDIYQNAPIDPAIVLTGDKEAFGVIMPARTGFSAPAFWFDRPGMCVTAEAAE